MKETLPPKLQYISFVIRTIFLPQFFRQICIAHTVHALYTHSAPTPNFAATFSMQNTTNSSSLESLMISSVIMRKLLCSSSHPFTTTHSRRLIWDIRHILCSERRINFRYLLSPIYVFSEKFHQVDSAALTALCFFPLFYNLNSF